MARQPVPPPCADYWREADCDLGAEFLGPERAFVIGARLSFAAGLVLAMIFGVLAL